MRENAGTKLKGLALLVRYFGSGIAIIVGIALLIMGSDYTTMGIAVVAAGVIASVLAAMFIDAFGSLVDNSYIIVDKLGRIGSTELKTAKTEDTVNGVEHMNEEKADDDYDAEPEEKIHDKGIGKGSKGIIIAIVLLTVLGVVLSLYR